MNYKKISVVLLLATSFLLGSCGADEGYENGIVYVYNWGDYIDDSLIDKFEEETGIKVVYDTFDSNESMYVKMKSGGVNYDVVIPSDYMVEKMIDEDMLEPINFDNIPNYKYIREDLKHQSFDENDMYSVPYFWGTVGILYNTTMVNDVVDSWDILWDDKYDGQIFMYDSERDSMMVALKKLGYSLNTTDEDELREAQEILIEQKPLVQAYFGDAIKDKMIGEEGVLAVVYSGDAMYCMDENENLAYALPKEGSNTWTDSMVIPKGAENKENAEAFINFMTDPENALINTEYVGYSTPNEATFGMLDEEMKSNSAYWPSSEDLANNEVFQNLDKSTSKLYARLWTEVLASR